MLKFYIQSDDNDITPIIGIGISQENAEILKEGHPIIFNVKKALNVNIDVNIMLMYGETEEKIKCEIQQLIDEANGFEPSSAGDVSHVANKIP